jgi:choline dehydrogenase-like flavoprotein
MATQRSNHIDFDILVIGSGAGGGTVAKELSDLCDKGYRIGLLEWGARFLTEHHNRDEFEMARHYYFDQGGFTTESQDMTLAFAKSCI